MDGLTSLIVDLFGLLSEELRKRPTVRMWIAIVSAFLFVTSLSLNWSAFYIFDEGAAYAVRKAGPPISIFSGLALFIALVSFTSLKIRGGGETRIVLTEIRKEREEIQHRIAEKPKPDVFDTIQLSLNQLSEYYAINKSQAKSSFRFSVFSIIVGLVTLITGIWLFYFRNTPNLQMTAITSLSGVLIQFIGGAYFYLYRKSLVQLNYFFEQLIRMQDTMLSIRLCQEFSDQSKQSEIRETIILTLLERSSGSLLDKDSIVKRKVKGLNQESA